ncbi:hypothetical protein AL073_10245 [Loktanella sp. 1ANDIMAR09]|nr:hypothetical protein AL073_10245 [Loktanella sp. 1ANDIMAR09]
MKTAVICLRSPCAWPDVCDVGALIALSVLMRLPLYACFCRFQAPNAYGPAYNLWAITLAALEKGSAKVVTWSSARGSLNAPQGDLAPADRISNGVVLSTAARPSDCRTSVEAFLDNSGAR